MAAGHAADGLLVGRVLAALGRGRRQRLARNPLPPDLAGDADHLRANRVVLDAGLGQDLLVGQVAAEGVPELAGEEVAAQPAVAARLAAGRRPCR